MHKIFLLFSLTLPMATLSADYAARPDVQEFARELATESDFDEQALLATLAQAEYQQRVIDSISRPAERELTWAEYQDIFLTTERTACGVRFMSEQQAALEEAYRVYGVPPVIVTAIIGVETMYGRFSGDYRVLDALVTLAFEYPPRSAFFRSELKQFFQLAREEEKDPTSLKGSYAGAMGLGQFISSSYRHYAVDFDGDGLRDIWNNRADAIGSVANYLSEHDWQRDAGIALPVKAAHLPQDVFNVSLAPSKSIAELQALGLVAGLADLGAKEMVSPMRLTGKRGDEFWLGLQNFYAITRYNHSELYAMAVFQLSEALRQGSADDCLPSETVKAPKVTPESPSEFVAGDPFFNPLTQSTAVASPNHINELNSPWQVPAGVSQRNLMSLKEVEADSEQSIQRVPAGNISSMFDMMAYDPTGRYLFIPHETPFGAGVSRYDTAEDRTELLFAGDSGASDTSCVEPACERWANDFAAFDPARWTPNGTVLLGEEWSGLGRVVEILNPLAAAPENPIATSLEKGGDYRVLESIANVAHEGINFSLKYPNRVIYYIDEWNSGSIYALVLKIAGDYVGGGQTFVLSVDTFLTSGGDAAANWNEGANTSASRFGLATWQPITDENGNPLEGVTDPFRDGPTIDPRDDRDAVRGGRAAADDVGGTPYGRPEDMEVALLDNLNEVLYITTTSEHAVLSVEMLGKGKAMVRRFASFDTPRNLGFAATTGILNAPDNLAQDTLGNIYIVEDAPNRSDVGGDIWFARDSDQDGVAESINHFMSLQVNGSESTGMIFHPTQPTKFVVAVQHPNSTDLDAVPEGFGDAVWEFDLAKAVPPSCRPEPAGMNCDWADASVGFTASLSRAAGEKAALLQQAVRVGETPMQ